MGISPVDMQVMLTKTTELASKHSTELHKAVTDQQKVSEKETQKQEENTKKVHERDSSERIYVDEEDKNKNKQDKNKSKSGERKDDESEEEEEEFQPIDNIGRHFDASVWFLNILKKRGFINGLCYVFLYNYRNTFCDFYN